MNSLECKEIIEELNQYCHEADIYVDGELYSSNELVYTKEDVIRILCEHIEAQSAKQGQWISVKDKLPNYLEEVLCYISDGCVVGYYDGFSWHLDLEYVDSKYVTYWRPLPEPPNVVKAAWNIFGDSYRYRQAYNDFKAKKRAEQTEDVNQIKFW